MMLKTQRSAAIQVENTRPLECAPMPERPSSWKSKFVVLFAALLANAAIVLVGLPNLSSLMGPSYNLHYNLELGDLYDVIAKNLDQGNGYRADARMSETMLREPGYPLFLAGIFKLGGYSMRTARIGCVLLAFGAALLLLRLTRKITGDSRIALLAALLFLFYPGVLVAETRAGIEIPCIFTMMLFMLALHGAVKKGSLGRYGAAGLLLGTAVVVRSEVLLFPVLLLAYLLFAAKGWAQRRRMVRAIALLALGTAVVMSPWIIRNYRLVHSFVPTATIAGLAAQAGLYTCENTSLGEPFFVADGEAGLERKEIARQLGIPFTGPYFQLFYTPQDELVFYRALLTRVSAEYRSHPEVLAGCAAKNLFFNFWFLGKTPKSVLLNVLVQAPLLALALAGIVVLWKRKLLRNAGIILLYILYIPAVHAPMVAEARYSTLIVPFLATLAAVSLMSVWYTLGARGFRPFMNLATSEEQGSP
jgi:4-amino-4-deoxy-L-arabinose transferase-like glycosyltransferase